MDKKVIDEKINNYILKCSDPKLKKNCTPYDDKEKALIAYLTTPEGIEIDGFGPNPHEAMYNAAKNHLQL